MNKRFSKRLEIEFENLVGTALKIYGHPFTFILACIVVIFFLVQSFTHYSGFRDCVRDVILSISFISFFIIQRAFNKTNTSIQIKINELITAHDNARNEMISIDEKTETELNELKDIHKQGPRQSASN
jgi:low affinity Fe/Cu permease